MSAPTATTESQALIRAHGLRVEMGGRHILDGVDCRIAPGEILTLIGPNGAGKTTLVRVLLGLLRPDAGEVVRRPGLRIGYVPQRIHIDATLPLNVEAFLRLGRRAQPARYREVLHEVGVGDLLASPIQQVSGGEMQRVLLARALLQEPELLVLDEPAQGVDVGGQRELYRLIARLRERRQLAIVIVSHDLHLVMAATDRVLCLNHHVCCSGEPEQVSTHPEYLRLFGAIDREFALYTHDHDHRHDVHGDVVSEPPEPRR